MSPTAVKSVSRFQFGVFASLILTVPDSVPSVLQMSSPSGYGMLALK